jgi:polyisoprenoid-binding protein YceI
VSWRAFLPGVHRVRQRWGIAALAAAMTGATGAADRYTLDPTHSVPHFEFLHLGATTQTGRFDKAGGTVVLDRRAHTGSVIYEVDTTSLNMGARTDAPDSPGFRLFEVAQFPRIIFRSTRLIFDGKNAVIAAEGQLTLLGVTKPITVTVDHFKCSINPLNKKRMCAGDVTAEIMRSDFGMLEYIPGISDEVKVIVPIEAYKD